MPVPSFVHLRLHSEYSITDGIVRINEAVERAVADGMPAFALTDLANLFGAVKFYQTARNAGIKPIIGADVWISNEQDRDKAYRVLLLCRSHQGYLRLCDLLSRAWLENPYRGRGEIKKTWLAEGGTEGLLCLSGALHGDIAQALLQDHPTKAEQLAKEWDTLFPDAFYLEIQRAGQPQTEIYIERVLALAGELSLPVVATHPVQFLKPDDFKAHEARVCIAEGYVLGDQRRPKFFTEEHYFKTQAEMAELFKDLPEALVNSVEIAKRCNLTLELGKNKLPRFPTPNNVTLDQYLTDLAEIGLEKRLVALYPNEGERTAQHPRYQQRLAFEIKMIIQMGFAGYFLIVADFINWAKNNGVPVGPGRGSGAGSLVAYSLGITDLDPLKYDLLFERFLNPERVSMPDFDIDFCQDGRERVIDYVKHKYGAASVAQIVTFGTMAAKAVIRDVGRVLDLPYNFCDQLAKLIPLEIGMTLAKARQQEPLLNERAAKEEEVAELLALAEKLEGLTRNVGMHAGGVLIAPGKLTDFCPLYAAGGSDSVISQFDKDDVEQIGLVKFDFLGLTTLTILDEAVKHVSSFSFLVSSSKMSAQSAQPETRNQKLETEIFSLENIPLNDASTYAIFGTANTTAVFQSESRSAKDLERRLKPDCFEDIIALMALNRPGPLQSGMVDDFIARKHGRERAEYFHPSLEPVLKPTYGVIVYQEQVMQIAQVLAGYTLGNADLLRRAMGKKKPEEMAKQRSGFITGAIKNNVNPKLAEHLFDLMEKFAEYGFNKSHSAAYALIAYQTAYLKAHYPAAFMAANLSAVMDDTDKVHLFYDDAKSNGLSFIPPDINTGSFRFVPVNDKQIRFGLGAIKGTGESAINNIVKERESNGAFKDLFDFVQRVDKRIVNRRVIEALIRAGAFDALYDCESCAERLPVFLPSPSGRGVGGEGAHSHRASLLASVGVALEFAEQSERNLSQASLFGMEESAQQRPALVKVVAWDERQQVLEEKQVLGFYLSGHPFHTYEKELRGFIKTRLDQLANKKDSQKESTLFAGIVAAMRTQMSRKGKMAIITLDDSYGRIEITVFNELFETSREKLKEDQLVIIQGKVSEDQFTGGLRIVADKILDLASARNQFARVIRLNMNGQANSEKLQTLLRPFSKAQLNGNLADLPFCPVRVRYRNQIAECELPLGEAWQVSLDDRLIYSLNEWLQPENVEVVY